jgi:hypothetical protein
MNTRNLPGGKGWPARKADNLTATCEPTVSKMWELRRLTKTWASMTGYRDGFYLPSTQYRLTYGQERDSAYQRSAVSCATTVARHGGHRSSTATAAAAQDQRTRTTCHPIITVGCCLIAVIHLPTPSPSPPLHPLLASAIIHFRHSYLLYIPVTVSQCMSLRKTVDPNEMGRYGDEP